MRSFLFAILGLVVAVVVGQEDVVAEEVNMVNHCWMDFTWDAPVDYEGDLVFMSLTNEVICSGWGGCGKHVDGACPTGFKIFNNDTVTASKITSFGFIFQFEGDELPSATFNGTCPSGVQFLETLTAGQSSQINLAESTVSHIITGEAELLETINC